MTLDWAKAIIGLGLLSGGFAGCSLAVNGTTNVASEIAIHMEECRERCMFQRMARQAWREYKTGCQPQYPKDFRSGFEDGFVDYLMEGGAGEPPAVPPSQYWASRYESPEGHERIQAWFDGYRQGAALAMGSGLRRFVILPSATPTPIRDAVMLPAMAPPAGLQSPPEIPPGAVSKGPSAPPPGPALPPALSPATATDARPLPLRTVMLPPVGLLPLPEAPPEAVATTPAAPPMAPTPASLPTPSPVLPAAAMSSGLARPATDNNEFSPEQSQPGQGSPEHACTLSRPTPRPPSEFVFIPSRAAE